MAKSKQQENGRREFLRRAAVAGGSAVVVAAAGKTVAAPVEPEPQQKPTREAVGYRETDHVRTYYSTCRN